MTEPIELNFEDRTIELAAQECARCQPVIDGTPQRVEVWSRLDAVSEWLENVEELLLRPEPRTAKASEWFLDNQYLIQRAILQIREDLPWSFYRQLPACVGEEEARPPRILAIARTLLDVSDLQISRSTVMRFIESYQTVTPLTIAELWALPTALRIACLEVLLGALERLLPSLPALFAEPLSFPHMPEETETVARAFGNLRVISSISWKDVFEGLSRVETILREDPVAVYEKLDFATADRYRQAVEALARATRHSEIEVAERVVAQARRFAASDVLRGHVGYWLIDAGQDEFSRSLSYRVPVKRRLERWLERHGVWTYGLALGMAMLGVLSLPAAYLWSFDVEPAIRLLGLAVAALPASALGVTVVHWLITLLLPPRVLAKLDFERAIPSEFKTVVVIPSLAGSEAEVDGLLERLEEHYLGNTAAGAEFILLTDFPDAPEQTMPGDDAILERLVAGAKRLNRRYAGATGGPFHVLLRPRRFNPSEGCWMAWERKRGKLEEFNRFLRGDPAARFSHHEGDAARLSGTRFVVTLDADTILPRGAMARLAGVLAHPFNRACFDDATGRVVRGYTVVQPRVEIEPGSLNRSWFTRLFAGDTAIDIYTRAVSDVYQDLFGSGIYIGKGIYDVDAFMRSVEGCVPENALASHDLFEGIHGRAALATDVVLYESFPSRYLEYARRQHRWVRGDWQLLSWLGHRVPDAEGGERPNRLTMLDRWKVVDNLRRSLIAPSLVLMLSVGWLVLPGSPWFWTGLGVMAPAGHLFTDLVTGFARGRRRSAVRSTLRRFVDHAGRWALLIAYLPFDAWSNIDAITRTLTRVFVTRRRLLEWTSAAHTASQLDSKPGRAIEWGEMWVGPVAGGSLTGLLAWLRPEALPSAAILLLLWIALPELAFRLSIARGPRRTPLAQDDVDRLRQLARRTWLFFESFAGPEDQWLPPDNFQEDPGGIVAHRTSPTNIAMLLLSSLAAWDLGHLGTAELTSRLGRVFDSLKRMDRYRGHLLNWYDTRSLEPLSPRYVSTVDSGNLAASLLALHQGCLEISAAPLFGAARWDGLIDMLRLLEGDLDRLANDGQQRSLRERLRAMATCASEARDAPAQWLSTLQRLDEVDCPAFEGELRGLLDAGKADLQVDALRDIRVWLNRVHHQIRELAQEIEVHSPWTRIWPSAPQSLAVVARELEELLPLSLSLDAVPSRIEKAHERLASLESDDETADWREALAIALDRGRENLETLRAQLLRHATEAESLALAMDFRWLYDQQVRLFHIGYNASGDQLDSHHYDLLASEARIASFIAIAKGDVPVEHWFHLGRPITRVGGRLCLVSWGGSMFEYLMPALLLRSGAGTLLAQSECAAIAAQKRFGESERLPWGVSESGFASLDADQNYRYRAFGVPGLGLRRDLSTDRVVAPYATVLGIECDPAATLANLGVLEGCGAIGEYGLYESIDFTEERLTPGRSSSIVRSYMAHHQGMILAALDNALCDGALRRRMHADPRVRSVELLLHERVPGELALERLPRLTPTAWPSPTRATQPAPWLPPVSQGLALHRIGNGRLSSVISDTGAGGLFWHEHALTRWAPDPMLEDQGLWVYVKDEETGAHWMAVPTRAERRNDDTSVVFQAHRVEFHRRDHGIAQRMEVAVVPSDDVEIRRFTLVNESDRPRTLTITSYAEIVLAAPGDDDRHPAFSKLFVESEWVEREQGLLFTRRPRSPEERPPVLLHRLVADAPGVDLIGFETDRRAFLGRGRGIHEPEGQVRSSERSTGFTLDSIASLCVRVALAPGQTQQLAFLTLAAGSRESVLETANRYQTFSALDWVISDAATDVAQQLQRIGIDGAMLPDLQRLASLLVCPRRNARGSVELIRGNHRGQPGLWGMGISGDHPILLLRIGEAQETELLRDLVRAHRLWREKGLVIDLVVLRESASGYVEPLGDRLLGLLGETGERDQLGRSGGIHFVAADQLAPDDRRLLQVVASVSLEQGGGSLESQLSAAFAVGDPLPSFMPSRWDASSEPTPELKRPSDLLFDNGIGGFSPDGREYVIFLGPGESTPAPWSNVLANEGFGCLVTESGGGFTWAENSGENRLTPWTNDPVTDACGEALYLRDEETGVVWTPTPAPAGQPTAYEVTHAAGRTRWRSNAQGLEQTLEVFVPPEDPVKLIHLTLRNHWDRPRRLTATYYVEWVLGSRRPRAAGIHVPAYDSSCGALLVRNPWQPEFAERMAFLAASAETHGVTGDREEFLGPGGSLRSPAALRRWGLSGRVEPADDPCGALQVHLELRPGEEIEVHFVLGQGDDRTHSQALVRRWRDPDEVARARTRTRDFWDELLECVQVKTPDPATDLMLNRWLLYQSLASRIFARTGFYQSSGAIGFRDQLQDMLALTFAAPDRLRAHLLECASRQFEQGDVLHWWHPPSGRGVRTRCSDDLLWLPFATALYVEATGDDKVLDEPVAFLAAAPLAPEESERYAQYANRSSPRSLFEHCARAIERALTRGPHDLPLIGTGDWNDGMDRVGKRGVGESIWLAWFAIATLEGFVALCDRRGESELAAELRRRSGELERAVEASGWDGRWYRRAIDDDGRFWGSDESEECRIDSIAQSWSVLSGAAPEGRAREALASAEEMLVREDDRIVRLLWPPFDKTLRDPGYIKSYPPGVRENGGQYTHAAAWLGLAFAELGESDRAFRVLRLLDPIRHAPDRESAERYRVEPYVLAADVAGAAPHVGQGGWTWYTGAAAWTWRLGVEGLLGIRRVEGGIRIEPCLPASWGRAEARVRGPAGAIVIVIEDPDRVGRGVTRIEVDGIEAREAIVRFPDDASERRVVVRLGRAARQT